MHLPSLADTAAVEIWMKSRCIGGILAGNPPARLEIYRAILSVVGTVVAMSQIASTSPSFSKEIPLQLCTIETLVQRWHECYSVRITVNTVWWARAERWG